MAASLLLEVRRTPARMHGPPFGLIARPRSTQIVGLGTTAYLWFSQVGEAIRAEMTDRKHDERAVLVGGEDDDAQV